MKTGKILKGLLTLLFASLVGAIVLSYFGVNPNVGMLCGAGTSVLFGLAPMPTNYAFATPVPATEVTAIAKWAGMYSKQMIAQVLNGLDIVNDVAVDRLVSRQGKLLPKFTVQGGLRPLNYNLEETSGKQRSWSGRKLFVYDAMKLFKIIPEELITSFQSAMLAPGAKDMPFAQWVWQAEMDKLASEINDSTYLSEYAGDAADYDAGVAYTYSSTVPKYISYGTEYDIYKLAITTTAGENPISAPTKWTKINTTATCTGFGKKFADEITASTITPITTGALTTTNSFDKIELMYKGMTVAHRNKGGVVRVSPDVFRNYLTHERAIFPYATDKNSGDGKKYIYGTGNKWEIRPCSWMGASGRVIMTPFDNLVMGTNLTNNPGLTNVVPTLHGYKAVAKFLIGFEIADLECLYLNDIA